MLLQPNHTDQAGLPTATQWLRASKMTLEKAERKQYDRQGQRCFDPA